MKDGNGAAPAQPAKGFGGQSQAILRERTARRRKQQETGIVIKIIITSDTCPAFSGSSRKHADCVYTC